MNVAAGGKRQRTRDQLLVAAQELLLEGDVPLTIKLVANRAGMVHASFYNYFGTIEALLAEIEQLFFAAHGRLMAELVGGCEDIAEIFALITRQTLRFVVQSPQNGRIMFDSGLPIDRFIGDLRQALQADIRRGVASGRFRAADAALSAAVIAGSVIGVALELHRGRLGADAVEAATQMLLEHLGVEAGEAARLARMEAAFLDPPKLPLTWQSIRPPDG